MSRRPPERRRMRDGFTLTEILVVIAIISILMGLLAPALGRARERGRITACTNNEYQLAFALLRYDEQKGNIPGWRNRIEIFSGTTAYSWALPLLPFLSRNDIYDEWATIRISASSAPVIEQFVCPSFKMPLSLQHPPTCYAANVGASGTLSFDGPFLELYTQKPPAPVPPDGWPLPPLSLDAISDCDGTSTTLAFAEKASRSFSPHRWDYEEGMPGNPLRPLTVTFDTGNGFAPVFGVSGSATSPVINQPGTRAFAPSSEHVDGVVVAFCDGHTDFLSNNVSPWVYGQLLTPCTRWPPPGNNPTNPQPMQGWLRKDGNPYILDQRDLKK